MARALILGGTGMIGQAAARRLLASGWQVDITGRNRRHFPGDLERAGANFLEVERCESAELAAALGAGADLLVDTICFTANNARALVPLLGSITSTVMISSKAVYVDAQGNHSNSDEPPDYGGPIREDQPTLPPGSMEYNSREGYGPNKVAAERVLLETGRPVTIIRPSKVHGIGAEHPREWIFVKRVLDRRPAILLANRGAGIDHPTAAANIAALIETVAANPGQRILNSADPDAPSGLEIARIIARQLEYEWDEVLLDGDDGVLGQYPWNARNPVILDTSAALALGYQPVGTYAETVAPAIDWLVAAARGEVDGRRPNLDDPHLAPLFDYSAEDAYLAAHRGN